MNWTDITLSSVLLIHTYTKIWRTLHSVQITRETHHLVSAPSFCRLRQRRQNPRRWLVRNMRSTISWILAVNTWTRKQTTKEQVNQTHLYTNKALHITCT